MPDPGLRAHTSAHQERRLEQPVERDRRVRSPDLPRVAHLPVNLGLAENHGIEPRRHAEEMLNDFSLPPNVAV